MSPGNSLREILVVLNGLVRFLVAIYCTQILFQIFRNPILPCHAPGNSCLISRSNSQRLENFGDKKRWDVSSNSERLEAPELPGRFKSFRSIQIGPFWYKKELSGKSYLLLYLATLLALLQGVCSKTDFPERISRSPLETALYKSVLSKTRTRGPTEE